MVYCRAVQRKQPARNYAAVALLLGFIVLAAALNTVALSPGLRIVDRQPYDRGEEGAFAERQGGSIDFGSGGVIVSVTASVVAILFVVAMLSRENRLPALIMFPAVLIALWLVSLMPRGAPEAPPPGMDDGQTGGEALSISGVMDREDAYEEPPVASPRATTVQWIIALIASVAAVALIAASRRYRSADARAVRSVAESARAAIRHSARGADTGAIVVRAYREMLHAYRHSHPTARVQTITPRELATKLASAGVDRTDAWDLTTLFERTRYGDASLSPDEEQRAIECLSSISRSLGA
ncbi:MAG: DUF4129 domain-containing protein [Spirochaetaceae bacterium]|nr:MAG: DUF4129 domain-containing protein [Spirochaetaceae bacterium]